MALAAFFYWRSFSGRKKYEWRDSWVQHAYSEQSDQPYGTQILHRLLQGYFPGQAFSDMRKSLPAELPPDSLKPASYVFVGEALFLDSLSTAHLLAFVKAGNTAFLSSKTIPFDLMFHLYFDECDQAEWNDYEMREDTLVSATVGRPALDAPVPLRYARQNQTHAYRWAYIEPYFFCDSLPPRPLGYLNDSMVNFAGFPYGKGRVLLHTTPIAFSNYHLLKQEGRAYTERVLSYLPEGNIYWDACSRVPETVARRRNQSRGFSRQLPPEHPLSYILQQAALAWSWYLLVGLAGVYLVFRAKRRQRIIPVLPKNENSSYEFINTIAELHFREKNYQNLCVQNMRLFLAQIRERYAMVAQLDPVTLKPRVDAHFIERLALVSEVPLARIHDIFAQYAASVQYEPTEDMMVRLHLAMEEFFKRAK